MIAALNPVLRGWVNYYRHAAANRTFSYLDYYVWWRVGRWLRKKHPQMSWKQINRRYLNDDYTYQDGGITLYKPARDARHALPVPGSANPDPVDDDGRTDQPASTAREPPGTAAARTNPTGARMNQIPPQLRESRMRRRVASPVRRAAARKPPIERPAPAPRRRPSALNRSGESSP